MSLRRVAAIVRKELREYRRSRAVVLTMAVIPLVFLVQPLVAVGGLSASAAGGLRHEHVLLYLLGIPALVPVFVAAYAVVGERQQGTLEPLLTTPIRRDELVAGKALAALLPSLLVAYVVFGIFLVLVRVLVDPSVAAGVIQGPDVLAQVIFTPLLALWSIWVAIALSTRASDIRVAQQLSVVASLPVVFAAFAVAIDLVPPSLGLGVACAVALGILDFLGWRVTAALFDRERLISGERGGP